MAALLDSRPPFNRFGNSLAFVSQFSKKSLRLRVIRPAITAASSTPALLQARFAEGEECVAGAARMVEFCREHSIPHDICGKVVVATDESERAGLAELMRRGAANGVPGLRMIDVAELRALEPNCTGIAAMHVPGTGIPTTDGLLRNTPN